MLKLQAGKPNPHGNYKELCNTDKRNLNISLQKVNKTQKTTGMQKIRDKNQTEKKQQNDRNHSLSITTLHVNRLNSPIKRENDRMSKNTYL